MTTTKHVWAFASYFSSPSMSAWRNNYCKGAIENDVMLIWFQSYPNPQSHEDGHCIFLRSSSYQKITPLPSPPLHPIPKLHDVINECPLQAWANNTSLKYDYVQKGQWEIEFLIYRCIFTIKLCSKFTKIKIDRHTALNSIIKKANSLWTCSAVL